MNSETQTPGGAQGRGRPPKRGPRGARRYKDVMVGLEPAMIEALDRATEAEGMDSRSEVVRRACASYLRRAGKRLSERTDALPAAGSAPSSGA